MLSSVRVLGIDHEVVMIEDDETCGEYHQDECKITISEGLHPVARRSTVLHEIIEAINGMLELKLRHPQISGLEAGLMQVLQDNPELVYYLGESTDE